ncbi:MAG: hypothetical protein ACU0BS_14025 [Hasllibacter sp.]
MTKSISSCREDAFVLNGLLRGLSVLHGENGPDARDGVSALVEVALERAAVLARDLDALDRGHVAARPDAVPAADPDGTVLPLLGAAP